MLEGLREALGYVVELGNHAAETEVVEIAGQDLRPQRRRETGAL